MAFTRALYYPWIDIRDEAWLKNAMLYWEKIQTIVPSSIEQPYSTDTAQEFFDEGLLQPYYVESNMRDIRKLTKDVLKYLESPDGAEVLMSKEILEYNYIHLDKLPEEITELVNIHPEKLPIEIRYRLQGSWSSSDWARVNPRFADFYMTLLATRLSEKIGTGLLTDKAISNKLANAARFDGGLSLPRRRRYEYEYDEYWHSRNMPRSLAQGILADLIFKRIQIDPNTSVKKILKFRADHSDELGHFRENIAELTGTISNNQTLDQIRQQAEDIYLNKVKPAMNSLKEELTDSKIKWGTENFLKVTFFSSGSTSIPIALIGLSVPVALLGGAGVSLIMSSILYNRSKKEILRNNPFSYLLSVEKSFH